MGTDCTEEQVRKDLSSVHDQDIVTSEDVEARDGERPRAARAGYDASPQPPALVTTSTSTSATTSKMAFDLGTPVNTALLLYILYSIQRIIFPSNSVPQSVPNEFKNGYTWMPKSHPPTLLYQTYTPKTLVPFNGEEGKRILLAIKGVVYDVTAGRNFYGPSKCRSCSTAAHRLTLCRWDVRQLRGQRCLAGHGQAVL